MERMEAKPKETDVGCPLTSMLKSHLLSCWAKSIAVRQENATAKFPFMVGGKSLNTFTRNLVYYLLQVHPAEWVDSMDVPYSSQTCLQKLAAGTG